MLRGNWLSHVAAQRALGTVLALAVALAFSIWLWPDAPPIPQRQSLENYDTFAKGLDPECFALLAELLDASPYQKDECSSKDAVQRKGYRDLAQSVRASNAAEEAAWLSYLQTRASVVGAAFLVLTLAAAAWTAWVAADAAKMANKSAAIAETALRVSERAKLWVDKITIKDFIVGKVPSAVYQLTNTGRTHAEVISIEGGYAISTEEMVPASPPYKINDENRPAIVGANSSIQLESRTREPLTPEEVSDVATGRRFLFAYGRITCRDEFNWTCVVGFGGQFGSFNGDIGIQFMRQPGYTYIRWHPPKQNEPGKHA